METKTLSSPNRPVGLDRAASTHPPGEGVEVERGDGSGAGAGAGAGVALGCASIQWRRVASAELVLARLVGRRRFLARSFVASFLGSASGIDLPLGPPARARGGRLHGLDVELRAGRGLEAQQLPRQGVDRLVERRVIVERQAELRLEQRGLEARVAAECLDGLVPGRGQAERAGRQVALLELVPGRLGRQVIDARELQGAWRRPSGVSVPRSVFPLRVRWTSPADSSSASACASRSASAAPAQRCPSSGSRAFLSSVVGGPLLARDEQPRQHELVDRGSARSMGS